MSCSPCFDPLEMFKKIHILFLLLVTFSLHFLSSSSSSSLPEPVTDDSSKSSNGMARINGTTSNVEAAAEDFMRQQQGEGQLESFLYRPHLHVDRETESEKEKESERKKFRSKRSRRGQHQPQVFNIGAVLSSGAHVKFLEQQIKDVQSEFSARNIELRAYTEAMNANPIRTAQLVCGLISRQVYTVIVSHPESAETSPASVSFTCGFYDIPVIGISNRDSSLSNKNLHGSFMRTISPYSHQADVWIQILKRLHYHSVIFIHSSDNDGLTTLDRFQNKADEAKIKIEMVIEYESGFTNIVQELKESKREFATRVFILYANREDAEVVFNEIDYLQMTKPGYVWIVSEQALKAANKPHGLIGMKLKNGESETLHIKDSVRIFTSSLLHLLDQEEEDEAGLIVKSRANVTEPPNDCGRQAGRWDTGIQLLQLFKQQSFENGATGRIRFDESGDRLDSDYYIINVVNDTQIIIGSYEYSVALSGMDFQLDVNAIKWPGNLSSEVQMKPFGYYVPTHLKVVTIEERPFVAVKPPHVNGSCPVNMQPCPKIVRSVVDGKEREEMFCCEGYCMDLLKELSERLNFTYELYQVADGSYGSYEFSEDGKKVWNGLVGELVSRKADITVAPLTINPSRAKVIDFTKPFKFQGIAMIQKKKPKKAKLESFLQPFRDELWLLVFLCVFVVAAALYVLDRYSPFGKNMMKDQSLTNEKSLNFSSAIWFSFGVLLNSGIGEKTPMSFSARVLGMVWAGFSMIVVASYTANLAAWLVLDTTETEITGLEDSRLRNPVEGFRYGTVKGSYVDMYFKGQVELSNMYRLMEENNMRTVEEALKLIKSGNLNVFFWDSPRLEFEAAYDCDLIISGETFARSGYGLGLQKNSFWSERVTLQLLQMHESGFMEGLDNKWILKSSDSGHCGSNKVDDFQTTLGLETMSAVFFLVAGGFLSGLVLIVIEVSYKRRKVRKLRQIVAAKKCAIKWLSHVQKQRLLRGQPVFRSLMLHEMVPSQHSVTGVGSKPLSPSNSEGATTTTMGGTAIAGASSSTESTRKFDSSSLDYKKKSSSYQQDYPVHQTLANGGKAAATSAVGINRKRSKVTECGVPGSISSSRTWNESSFQSNPDDDDGNAAASVCCPGVSTLVGGESEGQAWIKGHKITQEDGKESAPFVYTIPGRKEDLSLSPEFLSSSPSSSTGPTIVCRGFIPDPGRHDRMNNEVKQQQKNQYQQELQQSRLVTLRSPTSSTLAVSGSHMYQRSEKEDHVARNCSRVSNRSVADELPFMISSSASRTPSPCPGCPPGYYESRIHSSNPHPAELDVGHQSYFCPDEGQEVDLPLEPSDLLKALPPPASPSSSLNLVTAERDDEDEEVGETREQDEEEELGMMMEKQQQQRQGVHFKKQLHSEQFPLLLLHSHHRNLQEQQQQTHSLSQQPLRSSCQTQTSTVPGQAGFLERRAVEARRRRIQNVSRQAQFDEDDYIPPPPPPPSVSPSRLRPVPCYPNRTPRSKPRAGK